MSPFEHGEVFVLDDGGEVDLDLGNYERFLNIKLTRDHNITTGKVYEQVGGCDVGFVFATRKLWPADLECRFFGGSAEAITWEKQSK